MDRELGAKGEKTREEKKGGMGENRRGRERGDGKRGAEGRQSKIAQQCMLSAIDP